MTGPHVDVVGRECCENCVTCILFLLSQLHLLFVFRLPLRISPRFTR
jgi:hypothetical protein